MGGPDQNLAREKGVHASGILVKPDAAELAQIAKWIDAGKIKVTISRRRAAGRRRQGPPTDRDRTHQGQDRVEGRGGADAECGDSARDDAGGGRSGLVRGLGPIVATALVVGNIVGSGIYVIPASLAEIAGPVSLLAWGIVAGGYFLLAVVYTDLASAYPVTGGLQVYVGRAFGKLAGLETGFLYWVSCITGNAAFVTAFVGYLQVLVPGGPPPLAAFLVAQALLWTLTLVNVLGVRVAGGVQIVGTVLKVVPLMIVAVALLFIADAGQPRPLCAPRVRAAIFPALALVAWLFTGAETVTIPAEEIRGARRTLPRAALLGLGLVTALYLLVALSVTLGCLPPPSPGRRAPWRSPESVRWVHLGRLLVVVGALASTAGILNGCLLVTGRLPPSRRRGTGCFPRLRPPAPPVPHAGSGAGRLHLDVEPARAALLQPLAPAGLQRDRSRLHRGCADPGRPPPAWPRSSCGTGSRTPSPRPAPRGGPVAATVGLVVLVFMIGGTGTTVLGLTLLVMLVPLPLLLPSASVEVGFTHVDLPAAGGSRRLPPI